MKLPRTYNVIVISSGDTFNKAITAYLPEHTFPGLTFTDDPEEARRLLFSGSFDIAIINPPLSGDPCFELAKEISLLENTVVLFCAKDSVYSGIRDLLTPHGVFTLMRPASEKTIRQTIDNLCAFRERLRKSEKKVVSVEEKMAEIRLVNRAKWLLIENENMTEEEAHRFIEKSSMNLSIKRAEFCERIIKKG